MLIYTSQAAFKNLIPGFDYVGDIDKMKERIKKLYGLVKKLLTKENLKSLWIKIWGKDAPPAEELFPDDIYAYYHPIYLKLVKKIKRRRYIIISVFVILGIMLLTNAIQAIRYNPVFACFGKEVCITRGPKLQYPYFYSTSIQFDNGDIFIIKTTGYYSYIYHMLTIIKNSVVPEFIRPVRSNFEISKFFFQRPYKVAELYVKKHNKFIKLRGCPEEALYEDLIKDSKNNVYILKYYTNKGVLFNAKKRKFSIIFNNPIGSKDYLYITNYNSNDILVITNFNKVNSSLFQYGYTSEYELTKEERLFLHNLTNSEMTPMPKFEIAPKIFPSKKDIKVLKNGGIIVPIKTCDKKYFRQYCSNIWDHIEIYNPKLNKFKAELNTEVLNKNYFDYEMPNGNILFVNENSSWIFNINTFKFEKVDLSEEIRFKQDINKIDKLLNEIVGISLKNPQDNPKIIKIAPDKFLITCETYERTYSDTYISKCNNTVYYNLSKHTVTKGPEFLYPHKFAQIQRINNNTAIVTDGYMGSFFYDYERPILPYKYSQIIKVKD